MSYPETTAQYPGSKRISLCLILLTFVSSLLLPGRMVLAQERWFQVEVSVFSNESYADRAEEVWQAAKQQLAYPDNMRKLQSLLDFLFLDSLLPDTGFADSLERPQPTPEQMLAQQIAQFGPEPATTGTGFNFIDFERDSFLQLPNSASDFQQTNRALERSPDHRLLFHGLWRQPVENTADAIPVFVSGGQLFGEHPELQGSITIRFNDNRDRVVIDTNLWLTEFSTVPLESSDWELPDIPGDYLPARMQVEDALNNATWHPIQVYLMQQSREMRSTEFHYLDHPALGVVIEVNPYEVPPLILQPEI